MSDAGSVPDAGPEKKPKKSSPKTVRPGKAPTDGKHDLRIAVVAAVSALAGAAVGAGASIWIAHAQIDEQRATEARERKAQVYSDYLNAANNFSVAAGRLTEELKTSTQAERDKLTPNTPIIKNYYDARSNYQDQVNRVYVYGSDEAWKRHRTMAGVLPPSLQSYDIEKVDSTKFLAAYQGFQEILCEEVPAQPRDGCKDH
ncbi:hypothetical protein ACWZJV_19545 [Nocardioides sp. WG-D5]